MRVNPPPKMAMKRTSKAAATSHQPAFDETERALLLLLTSLLLAQIVLAIFFVERNSHCHVHHPTLFVLMFIIQVSHPELAGEKR